MQMQAILERIATRSAELGLSEAALAQKGGSRDLIRNWRRALANGQQVNARYESLAQIARALNVTEDWLIHGKGAVNTAPPPQPGMAEGATPFTLTPNATKAEDPHGALRAIFGSAFTSPGLFRINNNLPAFELAKGDVVLADVSRVPQPGEIAVVVIFDEEAAASKTMICRYLPPYLTMGKIGPEVPMLRVDDPGVTVRHPVVGSIRGIPET